MSSSLLLTGPAKTKPQIKCCMHACSFLPYRNQLNPTVLLLHLFCIQYLLYLPNNLNRGYPADGSCIPAHLQKLQGLFNNLETNPVLSVVGSSAAFWFLAVLCNFQCTRLSTSMEQYLGQLWFVVCLPSVGQVNSFWLVYITHWKGKTRSCFCSPARHRVLSMPYGVQKCSAPC